MTQVAEVNQLKEEIKNLKQQLHDKEIVFNNILDSTLAGYWDWYIQDNYEYLSPTFKSMFGYEDHELPNSPETWQKIIHPEDLKKVLKIFDKHVATKGEFPYDNEVRYFHKNGAIVWVYCRGKVIEWDNEGKPVRMVGCHVDITKLKQAEEAKKYMRQLEVTNKELEQFSYVASHDLQEPLRTVSGFTELLSKKYGDSLDKEGKLYIDYISQASVRMSELVKALLDYSRIGRAKKLKQVDCNQLIEAIKSDLSVRLAETNAKIEACKLPLVKGYETELRLLFQNLISNAIKFSRPDIDPIIKVSAEKEANYWKFSVLDNGIGIEPEHQQRIFRIFQRLHNKNKYEGTGIGLAHCYKIIDLHDGKIWVESEPNVGSNFQFTIPL